MGLAEQTGRRQFELLEDSGVGRLGWSGLHLGPKEMKTPHIVVKVSSPENMGGMVGGMKPLLGGAAMSA